MSAPLISANARQTMQQSFSVLTVETSRFYLERSQRLEILNYNVFEKLFHTWRSNTLEELDRNTSNYETRSPVAVRKILRWLPLQEFPRQATSLEEAVHNSSSKDDPFSNHSSKWTQKCKRKINKLRLQSPVQETESWERSHIQEKQKFNLCKLMSVSG